MAISTAYYGLFRIGEIADSPHAILANCVHVGLNKNKMLFVLLSSKTHNKGDKPQHIKISSSVITSGVTIHSEFRYCPFNVLKAYVTIRPLAKTSMEKFFVFADGTPVKAY